MDILDIPFVKHLGITKEANRLNLEPTVAVENHIGTMHAGALFTLAETQSGLLLQNLFPEHEGQVAPLLRSSNIKFKIPATITVIANAEAEEKAKEKFISQFEKKGRASITISVELTDEKNNIIATGKFNWFVQKEW